MPMNSRDITDYNQMLIRCDYCPAEVQRSRMSAHNQKIHRERLCKIRARQQEVPVELPTTEQPRMPPQPVYQIISNDEVENWDDSNYPTYDPFIATANKPFIRDSFCHGGSAQQKKEFRKFEAARLAKIKEASQRQNFQSSSGEEVTETKWLNDKIPRKYVPLRRPHCQLSHNSNGSSTASSSSSQGEQAKLDEAGFFSTEDNFSSFGSSVAEFLVNLSGGKRAEAIGKFKKIMSEY